MEQRSVVFGLRIHSSRRERCPHSDPRFSRHLINEANLVGSRSRPVRRKLADERQSITHKFSIGGHEGYITVGMYDDGQPGEIFVTMAKEGSTISGLVDSFATSVSYCLQYGVPLKFLVDKFGHVRFEPSGWTGNPQIPYAKSIPDYIFRWLAAKFLGAEYTGVNEAGAAAALRATEVNPQETLAFPAVATDAPMCAECGGMGVMGECITARPAIPTIRSSMPFSSTQNARGATRLAIQ